MSADELASLRRLVVALEAQRDQWKHEAEANAAKLEGEMHLRSRVTAMRHEIALLDEAVKREREGFTRRRADKAAQWRELQAQRDEARQRLAILARDHDLLGVRYSLLASHSESVRMLLLAAREWLNSPDGDHKIGIRELIELAIGPPRANPGAPSGHEPDKTT